MNWNFTAPETHTLKMYVRPESPGYREVQMTDGRILENRRCSRHHLPVAAATFAWDITPEEQAKWSMSRSGRAWELGADAFERIEHADGSHCATDPNESYTGIQAPCGGCGQYETYKTKQEAYGDRYWCTTPNCPEAAEKWISIGD